MEFTLESGAVLDVTMADFVDSNSLRKAIMRASKDFEIGKDVKSIKDIDFSGLIKNLIEVATDDIVEATLFKCFKRVTYNKIKVTPSLFDDPENGLKAREDYHTICLKVIEVNCGPFFAQTLSVLKNLIESMSNIQSLKSISKTKI